MLERILAGRKPEVLPVVAGPPGGQPRAEIVRALRPDQVHAVDRRTRSASPRRPTTDGCRARDTRPPRRFLKKRPRPARKVRRRRRSGRSARRYRPPASRASPPSLPSRRSCAAVTRLPGVAMRARVVADAAEALPVGIRTASAPGERGAGAAAARARGEQRGVEEVAPRDARSRPRSRSALSNAGPAGHIGYSSKDEPNMLDRRSRLESSNGDTTSTPSPSQPRAQRSPRNDQYQSARRGDPRWPNALPHARRGRSPVASRRRIGSRGTRPRVRRGGGRSPEVPGPMIRVLPVRRSGSCCGAGSTRH